jgi:hypothetical protein
MSTQGAGAVAITGGSVNGTTIGATTPSTGVFTNLTANTNFTLNGTTVTNIGGASGLATLDGTGKLTTGQIPASLVGAVVYQGTWNASTNSPTLTSSTGTKGNYYKVSVAGSTAIDGISQWNIGDTIIFDGTVWDKIDGIASEVISVAGRTGAVTLAVADVTGAAPLASPALTGTPTAPTAAANTNTTQLATTAFVLGQASSTTPNMDGTATIGTGTTFARADHIHPTDTSRAPLASPALTGTPTAPTAAAGDSSTTIATTAFVANATGSFATISVAGGSNVTLNSTQSANNSISFTGALTANIAVIVPSSPNWCTFSNNTSGAFTLTVKTAAGTGVAITQGKSVTLYCDGTNVYTSTTDFPSIALTGVPTAPTAAVNTNTTQIATTAFVMGQVAAGAVTSVLGFGGAVTLANLTSGGVAPLASPTFTGTPAAPTATLNTNTTQVATTAFVLGQVSTTTPAMDGTATIGNGTTFARADHIHPTDTSRAPLASPTFTGTPAAPTAAANTNTTQVATTAFVLGQASSTTPNMDGAAAVGTGTTFARADHVHPTDTSRAPLASPTFTGTVTIPSGASIAGFAPLASPALTGTPTAPTAAANTSTTQIATTAFVVGQQLLSPVSVFTSVGSYTVSATDEYVIINKTAGAATGVTLPSSPATGRMITIKDGKGDAATNNITVTPAAGTIDGAASLVMDQPYEAYSLIYNGTQWNIV